MKPLSFIALSLVILTSSLGGAGSFPGSRGWYTFQRENVLGTSFELKIAAANQAAARKGEAAALAEIERQAKILSAYDPQSEFSRWIRTSGQAVTVSAELFEVLGLFDQWRERSGGALDAAAEAVGRVWKAAGAAQRLPSDTEIAAAVASVRRRHWRLDAGARTATHLSDTPLALNSFAKSYIVGHAADAVLRAGSVTAVVVNIGGDLVVRGAWAEAVNIADPLADAENSAPIAQLVVRDRAVATSGNYRRGVRIGDRFYSHIVDPRTGQPVDRVISSTVVAADPAEAGALATAFSVLTPQESRRLAAGLPGVEYLLVERNGNRLESAGWHALEAPQSGMAPGFTPGFAQGFAPGFTQGLAAKPAAVVAGPAADQAGPSGAAWDASFELTIHLELARLDGMRARRPYVAAWIEDKDKFPLRTIGLWFNKTRWLPELRAWNRDDRMRAMAEGNDITASVSSATRPPGRYTLKWDGKDNAGKSVRPGKYTVCIEVAREHGSHQIIRQEMEFAGVPKQVQLAPNEEVAGASLDYARKVH
jgi:thiamine biosynthesis lipoprotein